MFKDYFKISIKNLSKKKLRSYLTLLGIFIGIAAVVSLISLGTGLKLAVASQFNILGAERIVVQAKGIQNGPPGSNVANSLTKEDLEVVQKTNGVEVAAGRIIKTAIVTVDKKSYTTYIGSLPKDQKEREWINEIGNTEIAIGRELKPSDKYKVTIGNDYYEKEKFGKRINVGDIITIQGKDFEVVGIHVKKGAFTVDGVIAMNEDIVRELYSMDTEYSLIGAKAVDVNKLDEVSQDVKKDLRKHRGLKEGKEDFEVQTNQQAFESISDTLNIVTILLSGIAAISIIVGGIGIMNTMYTSVLERQTDIGIMKAIGARNFDIFQIFFIESGLLGLVGGVIGIILGIGLGKLVELIGTVALGTSLLQAAFSPTLLIGALLFSFIIGALAGTLPALGAAKLNPVDALRD